MIFNLKSEKAKMTVIRLEIYLPGEKSRFKYNTGRSIKPEHWDKKTRRAKTMRGAQGDRNRKLNLVLNEYEYAVERIRDLYGAALTKDKLKTKLDEYFHVNQNDFEIVTSKTLIKKFIEEMKELGSVTKSTLNKYEMIKTKFLSFTEKHDLQIEQINHSFLVKFITYLRNEYHLTDNTLQRNYAHFKAFLNWCDRNGHKVPRDYKEIKIKGRDVDDIALTYEEIKILETIKLDHRLDLHRDMFLIGIYSGQRFSDYSVFEKSDVRNGMIIKRAEKTETNH